MHTMIGHFQEKQPGSMLAAMLAGMFLSSLFFSAPLARAQDTASPETQPSQAASPDSAPPAQAGPAAEPVSPPPGPPVPTDDEIQSQVEELLSRDAAIAGHGSFKVKCEEGIVTLSGRAETLAVLLQAERRAGDVRGVLDVSTVAGISTAGAPDSQILLDIQQALVVPAFRGDNISVAVVGGRVHLNGTTTTYGRKLLAERSAAETSGVISVQNNLQVVAPSEGDDNELARRIRLLLTGGLTPVPGIFEVTVKGGEAILRGKVSLYNHRVQAERLALSVGGVHAVENRLKVDPSVTFPRTTIEVTP